MTQPLQIDHLQQTLSAAGRIDPGQALQLRRMIYTKGTVTKSDAEILFKLDRVCARKDPSFAALYVEALTDYFVWQTEPRGYVTHELARFLLDNVAADGHVSAATELELLLNIVHWAREVPQELIRVVLEAVRQAVLLSNDGPLGPRRLRSSINASDVAILRKALHAPAGDGSLLITRHEADLLFNLNDLTGKTQNDPAWRDFFKLAIANHLLNPMNPPVVPTRDEAAARDRWLNQRGSIGSMLASIAISAQNGVPFAAVWQELDPTGAGAAKREAEAEERAARERLAREQVDEGEAKWVAARIMADGEVDANEAALLRFLKKEAHTVHPSLDALMKKAGA